MLYVLIIKWHGGLLFLIKNCQLSINGGGGGGDFHLVNHFLLKRIALCEFSVDAD